MASPAATWQRLEQAVSSWINHPSERPSTNWVQPEHDGRIIAVRCAPVKDDNLSLFIGLFRMPYGDLAKHVLQIASDLTQQIGGAANPAASSVASGLRIAEKVYDGITALFGLREVTPLFGF